MLFYEMIFLFVLFLYIKLSNKTFNRKSTFFVDSGWDGRNETTSSSASLFLYLCSYYKLK